MPSQTLSALNGFLTTRLAQNLPWFQGARLDHVRVESSSCCFPMVSFVCPRELVSVSFDTFSSNRETYLSLEVHITICILSQYCNLQYALGYSLRFLPWTNLGPRSPRSSVGTNQSTFSKGIPLWYPADQLWEMWKMPRLNITYM